MFYELTFITEDGKKATVTVDHLEKTDLINGERVLFYSLRPGTWAGNHIVGLNEIFVTEESAIVAIVENNENDNERIDARRRREL